MISLSLIMCFHYVGITNIEQSWKVLNGSTALVCSCRDGSSVPSPSTCSFRRAIKFVCCAVYDTCVSCRALAGTAAPARLAPTKRQRRVA